jgi:hypothetical protein
MTRDGLRPHYRQAGFAAVSGLGRAIVARPLAPATNLHTDPAAVVVSRVAFTLLGAHTTHHDACFDRRPDHADIGFGLTSDHSADRVADVGAVKIEPHRPDEVQHVRFAKARVGAAGARGGTVEAPVNTAQQEVAIKADGPRMPCDDLFDCRIPAVPSWH